MLAKTAGRLLRWLAQHCGYRLRVLPVGYAEAWERDPEFLELYAPCRERTMTSPERMYSLYLATRHVLDAGIEGDLVECGVWRGGSAMLMARTLAARGATGRGLHLFDTFEGMPAPGDEDVDLLGGTAREQWEAGRRSGRGMFLSPLEDVRAGMATTGYPEAGLRYVVGRVEDTLPAQAPARIALLRLDTDWYESTRHELIHLFPRLAPGGVLIIDDYGHWDGVRRAVDEYLEAEGVALLLQPIDYTGRIAIKAG